MVGKENTIHVPNLSERETSWISQSISILTFLATPWFPASPGEAMKSNHENKQGLLTQAPLTLNKVPFVIISTEFQFLAWFCALPVQVIKELNKKQTKHLFFPYPEEEASETLLSFSVPKVSSFTRKTQPPSKETAPKYAGTHLSFIPVCCFVHRHCWVNRCQLISVCFHTDPTVESQRQEIVNNLKQNTRRHWVCIHFKGLFAI